MNIDEEIENVIDKIADNKETILSLKVSLKNPTVKADHEMLFCIQGNMSEVLKDTKILQKQLILLRRTKKKRHQATACQATVCQVTVCQAAMYQVAVSQATACLVTACLAALCQAAS